MNDDVVPQTSKSRQTLQNNKSFLNDVKFVLDPFSGYAAFTAVAVLGYGLECMAHVLAGRMQHGAFTYTPIP